MDTIFSLSSAPGKAGVAVIRISGPDAFSAAAKMVGSLPAARQAGLRTIRSSDGAILDRGLVLVFQRDSSFTGEETVEFQVHGGIATTAAILTELGRKPSLRQAEPGEFTRRSFDNGRLDLDQVEGLADLIDAETEAQRLQAQRLFSGELRTRIEAWRKALVRATALLEATIDFADEEVPEDVTPEVAAQLIFVRDSIRNEIEQSRVSERVRHGFEVAIVGAPNTGKSTLLNRLVRRDAAITSEIAGTTRDVIEVRMDLEGLPVTLLDTAGMRVTEDVLEQAGIGMAKQRAESADLRIFLVEPGQKPVTEPKPGDLVVGAKADRFKHHGLAVSGVTGVGISELIQFVGSALSQKVGNQGIALRERHRTALENGIVGLDAAIDDLYNDQKSPDLLSEEIRIISNDLASVVGVIGVDTVLDEIFSSFCLGK